MTYTLIWFPTKSVASMGENLQIKKFNSFVELRLFSDSIGMEEEYLIPIDSNGFVYYYEDNQKNYKSLYEVMLQIHKEDVKEKNFLEKNFNKVRFQLKKR